MKQTDKKMKVIGGRTFYIGYLPAFKAANVSGELSAVVGPLLGGLAPAFKVNDVRELANVKVEDLLTPLASALSNVDGDKVEHLIKRLIITYENISVKCQETGNQVEILSEDLANEIFCGEMQDMLLLCIEVVKMNFKSFFKKGADQFGELRSKISDLQMQNDSEN